MSITNIPHPPDFFDPQSRNSIPAFGTLYKDPKSINKEIFHNEIDWKKSLNLYQTQKQNLEWGFNQKPHIFKHKEIKAIENEFNPILQKYNNNELNNRIKTEENIDLKNKIAKYFDNELRNEQTYDIITLRDRLKGFENHINYPKQTQKIRDQHNKPAVRPYNILSNYTITKHHYDKPENRPKINEEELNKSIKLRKVNLNNLKDYDIITNKYKIFNKEKKETDLEIEKYTAAKNFYKSRDYDLIKGRFYDPDKQKKYEQSLEENKQKILNTKRDTIFNPVSHEIYDKEKLREKELNNQNHKLRYTLRPEIEKYYNQKNYKKELKEESYLNNKLSYDRFKIQDQRGFDILTKENTFNKYKNKVKCSGKNDPWEIIKLNAGENETISKKGIYQSPYDNVDVEKKEFEFKLAREKMLKNLPKIEDEESFKRKEIPHKVKIRPITNEVVKSKYIDKKDWFKPPKSVDMYELRKNIISQ